MKEKPEEVGIALLRGLDKEENTLSRLSHSHSALRWQLAIHPLLWSDLPLCHVPSAKLGAGRGGKSQGAMQNCWGPSHTESSSH